MNRLPDKKTFLTVLLPSLLLHVQLALASGSGEQALQDTVGASDYFKVTCASNGTDETDHLNFKVIDSTSVDVEPLAPQIINAHLSKNGVAEGDVSVETGATQELTVQQGNGTYSISLDTIGTNLDLKRAQKYTIQYRCLNSDGVNTASSAVGLKPGKDMPKRILNNKRAKFAVRCAAKKSISPADTDSLYFKIVNTSAVAVNPLIAALPVLNAQVTKTEVIGTPAVRTLNASDRAGDLLYSSEINLRGGNGDYYISVNNTGTDDVDDNSKQYSFQYSCLNSANTETSTGAVEVVQDQ